MVGRIGYNEFISVMGICLFQENRSLSISPEDLIYIIFIKHFLSLLKLSKSFVFFIRTSREYLSRYVQESVIKDPLCKRILVHIEYSPDVLKKKTRILDIFNTDKKCFIKISIESSPREILIRIRFLEINGSPSLETLFKSFFCANLKHLFCYKD